MTAHYFIKDTISDFKKSHWTQNVCFGFLCKFCPKHFLL